MSRTVSFEPVWLCDGTRRSAEHCRCRVSRRPHNFARRLRPRVSMTLPKKEPSHLNCKLRCAAPDNATHRKPRRSFNRESCRINTSTPINFSKGQSNIGKRCRQESGAQFQIRSCAIRSTMLRMNFGHLQISTRIRRQKDKNTIHLPIPRIFSSIMLNKRSECSRSNFRANKHFDLRRSLKSRSSKTAGRAANRPAHRSNQYNVS